ncbi:MAG: hypothetical protein F6K17_03420 [Okeania sp. SIO3C4]|nr:hypothetical protein [Okeania sp. SIO3B3]NER01744.1 hypothetical protein [Okeania sp. SIO3C4]
MLVHSLQKLLVKSWSAKAMAVRRITQDNIGQKTAGRYNLNFSSRQAKKSILELNTDKVSG